MLVCVGIPSIDGKVCAQTVDSLLAEQMLSQGVYFYVMWEVGCSLIGLARNKLARRFLDTRQADCMVFLDADISWSAGELARLVRRPADVIGGTYRAKRDDEYYHIKGKPKQNGDLFEVEGIPGGFMKVSRHALETINAQPYLDEAGREMNDFFPTGMHNGQMFGEDYGFCRLWAESGGTVFLDPSIKLRHHDGTRHFTGDPRAWIGIPDGN